MDSRVHGTILVASGASGGHLFPALSTAEALREQGYRCVFVLGGGKFGELVTQRRFDVVRLPASAFNVRNPFRKLLALARLCIGFWRAFELVLKTKPVAAFGTGGYATVATMIAAKLCGVPTIIHEQNVLPGRANRLLSRWVDRVLVTFAESVKYMPHAAGKTVLTGMPLREEVLEATGQGRKRDKMFGIMVLGGSQGARILSEVVPDMVAALTAAERGQLRIIHQCRPEDVKPVRAAYAKLKLGEAVVESFFNDLPKRYAAVDLIIGRSGTGTLLETATLGKAAIYVPHQLADHHQLLNAQVAEQAGAAVILEQPLFTPTNLLVQVRALMKSGDRRKAMENAALKLARPQATQDVVKAVLGMLAKKPVKPAVVKNSRKR